MKFSKSVCFVAMRWGIGLAVGSVLVWAAAQSVVKSPLGSYLEINGQVIAPSTSKTLHSTLDLGPFDTVRWTSYSDTRITSPFLSEGLMNLPPDHSYVAGSVRKPANTTVQWQIGNAWTEKEPAHGAAVRSIKWVDSGEENLNLSTARSSVFGYRPVYYKNNLYGLSRSEKDQLRCIQFSDGKPCANWPQDSLTLTISSGNKIRTAPSPFEGLNAATGELFFIVSEVHAWRDWIVCINLDTLKSCGEWTIGGGRIQDRSVESLATVDHKMYYTTITGVGCFDILKRQHCSQLFASFAGLIPAERATSVVIGQYAFFMSIFRPPGSTDVVDDEQRIACLDIKLFQPCKSFPNPKPNLPLEHGSPGLIPIMHADGSSRGVCHKKISLRQGPHCYDLNGNPFTPSSKLRDLAVHASLGQGSSINAVKGTKIFVPSNADLYARTLTNGVMCFDFAKDDYCGFFETKDLMYTSSFHPSIPSCLLLGGGFSSLAAGNTRSLDVSTGKDCISSGTEITFDPGRDYFQCDSSRAKVTAWGQLRLSPNLPWGGNTGLRRVTATIKDSNGARLPDALSPVRDFPTNSYQLDLSDIPYKDYPLLRIGLEFDSPQPFGSTTVFGVDLTYEGDPIQVCVATKAPAAPECQTGATVVLKSRAVHKSGPGYDEELTASKVMSPGGLSTGYAAFPSATTARLNHTTISPRDPRTQIVQGRWSLQDFSGDLWAFNVNQSGQLEGATFKKAQDGSRVPSMRSIFTARPTNNMAPQAVTELDWANLADVQRQALNLDHNGLTDNRGQARLNYLKGTDANLLRPRNGFTLGPVINSAPVVLPTWAAESRLEAQFPGFSEYRKSVPRAYPLAIYGGNDGALHAYEATGDSLREAWTFVPDVMLRRAADFSDTNIAEIRSKPYFVDNVPIVGHVNTGSEGSPDWRAVAVILYGRGARAITALDVSKTDLKQGKGVLFEFTNTSAPDLKDLGKIISQPDNGAGLSSAQLVRLADQRSAVLVGNGIESNDASFGADQHSGTGTPVLYAFYLDKAESTKYRVWSLGDKNVWSGIEIEPEVAFDNGLSTPTPVDIDHNGTVDVVYAGDLKGNLWRFDVSNPSAVKATRLFKTDANQPITQAPFVSVNTLAKNCGADNAKPNAKRCWQVVFSTGAAISPLIGSPNVATQSIYGILDKGKGRSVELGILTTINYETNRVINGVEYRALKPTTVNYSNADVLGWRVNLQAYEHGVGSPRLQPTGLVMFSSVRPTTPSQATNICIGPRSWLNELDPLHGYSPIVAFDTNGDGNIDGQDRFDPDSDKPISPTSMAVSGSQFGPPAILRSASTQSQQMSLLLPSLGQDTGQVNSWSGGNTDGSGRSTPGANSRALTHANPAKLGRMTWREVY